MAITAGICDSYCQEILSGTHTDADTYKIALYTDQAVLNTATTQYTASGETVGTAYVAGGQVLTGFSTLIDSGTVVLDFTTNPQWVNATFAAAGALIYNSSKANKSVAVLNFGQTITATAGLFTVEFPVPDAQDGLIRFT